MGQIKTSLTRKETVDLIAAVGHEVTVMVEGHIGSGKSAMLSDLAKRFKDTHEAVYFDMTLLDLGDIQLPAIDHEKKTSTFYPNEAFGLTGDVPMILMFDEFGKAHAGVKNAVLPMLVERRLGNIRFHEDTIVFATTNLGEENVGDLFKAHERNRMSFVQMEKPDADSWIEWAANNDISPEVMAWVHQNPHCFASFEGIEDPNVNPYIFHPRAPRTAFVTHRSMEQASNIIKGRKNISPDALVLALSGTIGSVAAMDMVTFVEMGEDLPTRKQILADPANAPVPESPAAVVMLCAQSVGWVDETTCSKWMEYMQRFPEKEMQAFWAGLVVSVGKLNQLSTVDAFTKWVTANSYLFK